MTYSRSRTFPGVNTGFGTWGGGYETVQSGTNNLRLLGKVDCGGPFQLDREMTTHSPGTARAGTGPRYPAYLMFLGNNPKDVLWGTIPSDSSIKANGTTAIARTTPTNPAFDLSNAVGELMIDGLPSMIGVETWRNRAKVARSAGSEYLNYEFGYLPLVNDVRNFSRVVKNHQKIMSHYYENSGKNMHVSFEFPASFSSTDLANSGFDVALQWGNSPLFYNGGKQNGLYYRSTRTWFKGCYTYYAVPPRMNHDGLDSIRKFGAYADHLLGVRLTPETLWNLAPWSWAADWFTNTGDIIHNVSAFSRDSLVLKYGYIMSHNRLSASAYSGGGTSGAWTITPGSMNYTKEKMQRFQASPYFGFGTTGTLSGSQKAVLLALGLSRTGF